MNSPLDIPTNPENQGRYYEGRKVLSNRFILRHKLGQGGMGQVWLALDTELASEVALKFTSPELVGDTKAVADLRRAVSMGRELTHPHIIRIYDFHCDAYEAAISMEYIPGKNLSEWQALTEKSFFEAEEVHGLIAAVCEALDYSHQVAKRSHRDIKPKNIMFDDQGGTVKLADFDIGRRLTDTYSRTTGKEPSGSLPYMGPQQLLGESSRIQDDVYSLGATIYELLTGTPPFYQGDIREQVKSVVPPSMTQRRQDLLAGGNIPSLGDPIPDSWEHAVAACLSKSREQRPASAGAVLAMLQATPPSQGSTSGRSGGGSASRRGKSAPPSPARAPSKPAAARKQAKPVLISLAVMVLIGLIAWGAKRPGNQGRDRSPGSPIAGGPADSISAPTPAPKPEPEPVPASRPAPPKPQPKSEAEEVVFLPSLPPSAWEKPAAEGDAYAQALLSRQCHLGGYGQPIDRGKALQWAEKSAANNHPLGLYMKGILEKSDPTLSTDELRKSNGHLWFEKAVKAGFFSPPGEKDAQWIERMGGAYMMGRGVDKDPNKAVKLYQKAVDLGEPVALKNLAICYGTGQGVEKDEEKAVELYQKAADLGEPMAMSILGNLYLNGSGVSKDETEAVKWYRKAADLGEPAAMVGLGYCYETGKGGMAKDEKKAVELYQKAADLGEPQAMSTLGNRYLNGLGVSKDETEAVKWHRKAADLGDANGMNGLGVCYTRGVGGLPKDEKEAAKWYQKAADAGDAWGILNLGDFFLAGRGGLEKSPTEAFKWYRKAADLGNAKAMTYLGNCYLNGKGVSEDEKKAVDLYQKAADLGETVAMVNLAVCYKNGKGVKKDEKKAVELYQKAAEQGNTASQQALGSYYSEKETKTDWLEAVKWYEKAAANSSDGNAECNLGILYDPNKVRLQLNDGRKAEQWYRKAAEKGLIVAMYNLGRIFDNGKGVEVNQAEAERWYRKAAEKGHTQSMIQMGFYYGEKNSRADWLEAVQWYEKATGTAESADGEVELRLGWLYDPGVGRLNNGTKAEQWYRKAAEKGSLKAMYNLGCMFDNGNGVEVNPAEAERWYRKAAAAGHEGATKALRDMEK